MNLINYFFLIYALLLLFLITINKVKYKNEKKIYKINILAVIPGRGKYGAAILAKAYSETMKYLSLNKRISRIYNINVKSHISLQYFINFANKSNNLVWFLFSDYINYIYNNNYSAAFHNTIYGPLVSPKKWLNFPMNNTYEVDWSNKMNKIFSYIVQSYRIKEYLLEKSQKLKDIEDKYIISHGCLYVNESLKVQEWHKRPIDVLVYVKFADLNMENSLHKLLEILKIYFSVKVVRYGNHTRMSLYKDCNNSKILIYYSYYDCWPSALMEMMNMGIYPIVQHCEFVSKYGLCIKDFSIQYNLFVYIIYNILNITYNAYKISTYYRNRNNCIYILAQTLFDIYSKKTGIKYEI